MALSLPISRYRCLYSLTPLQTHAFDAQSILNKHHSLVSMTLGSPSLCTLTNTYVAALHDFAERIKQMLTAD